MSLLETAYASCPYCGEPNELVIDTSVPKQEYIEDCFVCCRPMVITIAMDEEGEIQVAVRTGEA